MSDGAKFMRAPIGTSVDERVRCAWEQKSKGWRGRTLLMGQEGDRARVGRCGEMALYQ